MDETAAPYPAWVGQTLIDDQLPWNEAAGLPLEMFAEQYTLHDSYWIGMYCNIGRDNAAILLVDWDVVWVPDAIQQQLAPDGRQLFLFIKIEGLHHIATTGSTDGGGLAREIADAEVVQIDGKRLMLISDNFGGSLEILFAGASRFLVFTPDRRPVTLSSA